MSRYIIRRLLILPIILTAVSMLIFAMLSLLTPYERASLYVQDISKQPGAIDSIIKKYGLDDPIPVQYWKWLVGSKNPDTGEFEGGVIRGNLGWSKVGKSSVWDVITRRLPATAELAIWAGIPMIIIGIWLGVLSAVKHNKFIDQVLRSLQHRWLVNSCVCIWVGMFDVFLCQTWHFPTGKAFRLGTSDRPVGCIRELHRYVYI